MEFVLTIKLTPGKPIQISGPLNDKVLCYGMLEGAKDAIREFVEKNQSPIIRPVGMPPNGTLTKE